MPQGMPFGRWSPRRAWRRTRWVDAVGRAQLALPIHTEPCRLRRRFSPAGAANAAFTSRLKQGQVVISTTVS